MTSPTWIYTPALRLFVDAHLERLQSHVSGKHTAATANTCRHPGCKRLTLHTRCTQHREKQWNQ